MFNNAENNVSKRKPEYKQLGFLVKNNKKKHPLIYDVLLCSV